MKPNKPQVDLRLAALRRFALAITVFNIVGRTWFGFEGAWAQVFVALFTAYSLEIIFEIIDSKQRNHQPRFLGGFIPFMNFLLPAHIGALAISMLLYATDRLLPYAFAAAIMILSKYIFTAPGARGPRHFLNPSNTGIVITAILFPSLQITVPYQFTENLRGFENLLLPLFIIGTGFFLNYFLTLRMPLIVAWVSGFAAFGLLRALVFGFEPLTGIMMMSGVAFVLFTFYMISDPGTTPSTRRGQIIFGLSMAAAYQAWVMLHQPFAAFYALLIVCSIRGLLLNVEGWLKNRKNRVEAPASESGGALSPTAVSKQAR